MEGTSSEAPAQIEFACGRCELREKADYHGCKPPFSRQTTLKYPAYVARDPFSPAGRGELLLLGSDCALCRTPVCIAKDCSLFYHNTYCLQCVAKNIDSFPPEIRAKLAANVK